MRFELGINIAGYEIVGLLGSNKTGVADYIRNVLAHRFEILKILAKRVRGDEEQLYPSSPPDQGTLTPGQSRLWTF